MHLRVLTTVLTSPELLLAQAEALKKHVVGDYSLNVVNDAYEFKHFSNMWQEGMEEILNIAAVTVDARYWRFPQEWHDRREMVFPDEPVQFRSHNNANSRCADAVQFGVNVLLRESSDPILILDADIIPTKRFDAIDYLDHYYVCGIPENKGPGIDYLWNGLVLVDPRKAVRMDLFNLDCGEVDGVPVDVGGMLGPFLDANDGRVGHWVRVPWKERFEMCGGVFAHLRGGGNWQLYTQKEAQKRIDSFIAACRE